MILAYLLYCCLCLYLSQFPQKLLNIISDLQSEIAGHPMFLNKILFCTSMWHTEEMKIPLCRNKCSSKLEN